jgi:hypothetical protein
MLGLGWDEVKIEKGTKKGRDAGGGRMPGGPGRIAPRQQTYVSTGPYDG